MKKATSSFQKIIRSDNSNITDAPTYAGDDETDHSDDHNVDIVEDSRDVDDDDDETKESSSYESISEATVRMRAFNHSNTTWIWEFPYNI